MNKLEKVQNKFISIIGIRGVEKKIIDLISNSLKIKLSKDFYYLSKKSLYTFFTQELYSHLINDKTSFINVTLDMREKYNLPKNSVILGEDEVSFTIMETSNDGSKEEVYIIAIEDFERYCDGEKLMYEYQYFGTFIDFFEYLLDQEEEIREILS